MGFPRLRKLRFYCQNPLDFSFLGRCNGLRGLTLLCPKFQQIELLAHAVQLRELEISNTEVETLDPIVNLKGLRRIDFSHTKVGSIQTLSHLPALAHIEFEGVRVPSYGPLERLDQLEWLAGDLPADHDISVLAKKSHLQTIMVGRGRIKTLEPLFPILLNGQIKHLSMLDTTVEHLPEGLKFDRYQFIQNLRAYWAGK